METIVDRIRALCRQKETSITKIEAELGYANGTIGKWAKGKKAPPLEKVIAIADRLGTSVSYLQIGHEQKEKPTPVSESGPAFAPGYELLTPENRAKADSYLAFLLAEQQRGQT